MVVHLHFYYLPVIIQHPIGANTNLDTLLITKAPLINLW